MSDESDTTASQAAAFQKIWLESMSKLMHTAFTLQPDTAPPEVLREIRSGIFQALAKSWDEYLRSPQFLSAMRQWMDEALSFRKMNNDLASYLRNELTGGSREELDTVVLTVRHMERRMLDRLEDLSDQVRTLQGEVRPNGNGNAAESPAPVRRPVRKRRGRPRAKGEVKS